MHTAYGRRERAGASAEGWPWMEPSMQSAFFSSDSSSRYAASN
eukprot:CAMPEP_0183362364 /NCGR_PEP_ID=MMETSP0164_2-20130417/68916_1 /TAXON_ID=221442 /ORGANISM="Coccolithus pelagicus ssp braarudi, Strain PLY182g" /LENGTH=42 /DNA_ID= /DNA_START= /DNA_END= /DNA_ORIENTATION=